MKFLRVTWLKTGLAEKNMTEHGCTPVRKSPAAATGSKPVREEMESKHDGKVVAIERRYRVLFAGKHGSERGVAGSRRTPMRKFGSCG